MTQSTTIEIDNLVALEFCSAIATWRPFRDEVAALIRINANALVIVGAKVHDIRIKRSVRRRLAQMAHAFKTLKGLKAARFRLVLADVTGLDNDVLDIIMGFCRF